MMMMNGVIILLILTFDMVALVDDDGLNWNWPALAFNIAIGLAIPIVGLLTCEFVLRRYAPRRKVE